MTTINCDIVIVFENSSPIRIWTFPESRTSLEEAKECFIQAIRANNKAESFQEILESLKVKYYSFTFKESIYEIMLLKSTHHTPKDFLFAVDNS